MIHLTTQCHHQRAKCGYKIIVIAIELSYQLTLQTPTILESRSLPELSINITKRQKHENPPITTPNPLNPPPSLKRQPTSYSQQ